MAGPLLTGLVGAMPIVGGFAKIFCSPRTPPCSWCNKERSISSTPCSVASVAIISEVCHFGLPSRGRPSAECCIREGTAAAAGTRLVQHPWEAGTHRPFGVKVALVLHERLVGEAHGPQLDPGLEVEEGEGPRVDRVRVGDDLVPQDVLYVVQPLQLLHKALPVQRDDAAAAYLPLQVARLRTTWSERGCSAQRQCSGTAITMHCW